MGSGQLAVGSGQWTVGSGRQYNGCLLQVYDETEFEMGRFEDLQVWQRAVALSISIYQQTQSLRDFGFRNQITKAGLSIPSNIAEGLERTSSADKVRFLDYARASSGEVRTQVVVGSGPGFIAEELANEWIAETKEISAMLQGLIRAIQKRSVKEQAAEYSLN